MKPLRQATAQRHVGRTDLTARPERSDGRCVRTCLHTSGAMRRLLTMSRSFLAGSIPLLFTVSAAKMRLITACGAGVLIGTALIVVIPEGIETLYSARPAPTTRLPTSSTGPAVVRDPTVLHRRYGIGSSHDAHVNSIADLHDAQDDIITIAGEPAESLDVNPDDRPMTLPRVAAPHTEDFEPHAWIGVSIIAGFTLMFLIDKLPHMIASSPRHPAYISLERLGLNRADTREPSPPGVDEGYSSPLTPSTDPYSSPLTTGLVIHAAADGIALGASTTSTQNPTILIFIALMLHKAPAAFGLTAILLKRQASRRRIRAHLTIFSLAAPIGALAAWIAANCFQGEYLGAEGGFATGVLLLFSGGTFL